MQNNVIEMKFVVGASSYVFGPNYPLYERTHENIRLDPQGPVVYRKNNIRLDGFFEGNDNRELQIQYNALRNFLDRGQVRFTYKSKTFDAGISETIHDDIIVYVDSFSEPIDWKQYDGSWSINLYYHAPVMADILIPISASLSGYTFPILPTWERSTEPASNDFNDFVIPNAQTTNGTIGTVGLKGMLIADAGAANPHTNLMAKLAILEAAVESNNRHGLLTYGAFSATGRITNFSCQETIPYTQLVFNISFKYRTTTIFDLKVSRRLTRTHWNPIIKERPYCGNRSVSLMNRSGQFITWDASCSADTIDIARAQLHTELANRILPGGIEMDGGDESQNENTNTVSTSITRFYMTPVITNIAGEGVLV